MFHINVFEIFMVQYIAFNEYGFEHNLRKLGGPDGKAKVSFGKLQNIVYLIIINPILCVPDKTECDNQLLQSDIFNTLSR